MHTCMKDKIRISYRIGQCIYLLANTLYSMLWMIAGNTVRVYCEVGKSNQGNFSMDIAVRTLPYYAKYNSKIMWCPFSGRITKL